jgi:hypothetical protein
MFVFQSLVYRAHRAHGYCIQCLAFETTCLGMACCPLVLCAAPSGVLVCVSHWRQWQRRRDPSCLFTMLFTMLTLLSGESFPHLLVSSTPQYHSSQFPSLTFGYPALSLPSVSTPLSPCFPGFRLPLVPTPHNLSVPTSQFHLLSIPSFPSLNLLSSSSVSPEFPLLDPQPRPLVPLEPRCLVNGELDSLQLLLLGQQPGAYARPLFS